MRISVALVLAALLYAAPARAGPEETKAIGARLADADLDVAFEASKELLALGGDALPAVEHLVQALDRRLPARMERLHWHPWMGIIGPFHSNVVRTLGAIGPAASAATPKLVAELAASSRHQLHGLVFAVLDIAPGDPAVLEVLCGVISGGRRIEDPKLWARLQPWIEAQGGKVVPALDGLLQTGRGEQRSYAAKRLAELGTPGVNVLLHRLEVARPNARSLILGVLIASKNLRGAAVQVAITEFAADHFSGDGRTFASALSTVGADVEAPLAAALADSPFFGRAWQDLWAAAPALARRTSARWVEQRAPTVCLEPFDAAGLRRTKLIGGGGGKAFEERISHLATLTGLHVHAGGWGHRTIVRGVRPLFDGPEGRVQGPVYGTADGLGREIRAEPGYAVAGLFAQGGHRVDGLAVLFLRLEADGTLDPEDGYVSPWVAGRSASTQRLVGGTGARVVGLAGRSGADLDAIGLVESKR